MLTVLAFLVTIGVLVTVHEYGHYRVAVACGVKVLRFSVGMGKPLLRWRRRGGETEVVLAALPLGGYVQMADEREGYVAPEDQARAFNNQPLLKRVAIVLAGPVANLLLAVLFFAAVNWWGKWEPAAVLSTPPAASIAAEAGLLRGDRVVTTRDALGATPTPIASFEDLRWQISRAALEQRDLVLDVVSANGASANHSATDRGANGHTAQEAGRTHAIVLPLAKLHVSDLDAAAMLRIGVLAPMSPPMVVDVVEGGAAAQAGLLAGDVVESVNGSAVWSSQEFIAAIQRVAAEASHSEEVAPPLQLALLRNGEPLQLVVAPQWVMVDGGRTAQIGARIGNSALFEKVLVRKGPWEGLSLGVQRTWEMSVLTIKMLWRMVIGEASIKNLSGPLSIAQYAGESASLGVVQFLHFMAIVSLSLGVLNLLPLPVLDGGHLMYYLWEAVTGRPASDVWMERLQRFGIVALIMLMAVALFNDVGRLFA